MVGTGVGLSRTAEERALCGVGEIARLGTAVASVGEAGGSGLGVGAGMEVASIGTVAMAVAGVAVTGSPTGPKPALPATIPKVASATNIPTSRPPSLVAFIVLGNNPLTKILFLQWHEVGRCELLDQGEKVTGLD